jgi:uncharacterized membrane protein YcaP (DUF421 family)
MCRFLGKKLISQMTFFDYVAGITLGNITASIIFIKDIPVSIGLSGLVIFTVLALILEIFSLKSIIMRKVINDEPTLIIENGKIYENGLKKSRLTIDNLLFHLRKKNIFYLDEVDIAYFETDGTVSILKKTESMPVTRKDIDTVQESRGLSQTFIIDGSIQKNSLKAINKDEKWVRTLLESKGISSITEVVVAQIDKKGNVYIDQRK